MRLGEIHEWLYKKIVLQEKIEEEIVQWGNNRGLPANEWMEEFTHKYGKPTEAKPLKKAIDKSNIHGWLEERVNGTEFRLAALITTILKEDLAFKEDIYKIFSQHGQMAAGEYKEALPQNPEEIYIVTNDFMLDGMPTDRVNEVLSGNENVFIWRTVDFLHKPYWDEVNGDVTHLYDLREAWFKGFVETLTPEYTYEKRPNGDHKIVRKI